MALILVGGLYAVYREHTRNVAVITQVPMPASTAMVHHADGGADSAAGQKAGRPALIPSLPDALFLQAVCDFLWHVGLVMFRQNIGGDKHAIFEPALGDNNALAFTEQAWQCVGISWISISAPPSVTVKMELSPLMVTLPSLTSPPSRMAFPGFALSISEGE